MNQHPERAQDNLEHIPQALERIERYSSGKSASDFMADTLIQDGILRNLAILGEAAHRLMFDAPDFVAAHPEIPLAKIYATRNRLIHAYENVDLNIVWNLVVFDVPDLRSKIAATLGVFREGNG